jgi:chaperonin GroES
MKIIPLGERVLLKAKEAEKKTASGLFIPQTAQEKTQIATVVAVGDDENIKVKVGQTVLHDKYAGTQIKDNGEDYLIVNSGDILAVIE